MRERGWSVLLALVAAWPAYTAPLAPVALTLEDRAEPLGVGDASPEFGWLMRASAPNTVQSAYQILVASTPSNLAEGIADKWDSGRQKGSTCAYVTYGGVPLSSGEVVYWTVRTWDAAGKAGPWADPARFEMGLLSKADWSIPFSVPWIWRPWTQGNEHVYFRKRFEMPDKPVRRARVYVSAMHHYRLFVDGKPAGWGPTFTDPEHQHYQTIDIGPLLDAGPHHVFALRCHWFDAGQGRPPGRPGLILKAVVEFEDSRTFVTTDRTWKVREAEWVYDGRKPFRNGEGIPSEYIDGRSHPSGWETVDYEDSDWGFAKELGQHPAPPWTGDLLAQETEIEEYAIDPVRVESPAPGTYVADFGKVYAGRPWIAFADERPGKAVEIKADYRRQADGTLRAFAQNTRMDYAYIVRGGSETFDPFWYLGFRFVQVSGVSRPTIRMMVRHNRVDESASSFECSDETINGIWDLAKRSVMLGSHECFVDTPTREQGQFTYDAYQTLPENARFAPRV